MNPETLGVLRGLLTLLLIVVFTGIVWWAWSSRRRGRFEDAANLPFKEPPAGNHRSRSERS